MMDSMKVLLVGGPDDRLEITVPCERTETRTKNCTGIQKYIIADFMVDEKSYYFGIHNSLTIEEGMQRVFDFYRRKK